MHAQVICFPLNTMWRVVIGGEVSPYESTITPPPITTRHIGELWHKLQHQHNSFEEGVSRGESSLSKAQIRFQQTSPSLIIHMYNLHEPAKLQSPNQQLSFFKTGLECSILFQGHAPKYFEKPSNNTHFLKTQKKSPPPPPHLLHISKNCPPNSQF